MREIRLSGSEGGGAVCSPYPYQAFCRPLAPGFRRGDDTRLESRLEASPSCVLSPEVAATGAELSRL